MRIGHNLSALNTSRLLDVNTRKQSAIAEKLSSGFRINRAGDNAAGLSISEKMRAQIRGLNQSSRNVQDGISLIETADGVLDEIHNIVQRMRELSVQAANGTSTEEDKKMIQTEIDELTKEVNRISNDTEFNSIKLLNGSLQRSHDSSYISLESLLNSESDGVNIIYIENNFATEQQPIGQPTGSNARYERLKNILKTEVVPQAVSKILNTYSDAFGYLNSSSIGIGLAFKNDPSTGELASLGSGINSMDNATVYKLTINVAKVLDNSGNIKSRDELEAIVAHEFIHGFMDEALTCGMSGYDSSGNQNNNNQFPLWFIEGMAQTASGGYANFNDFVNGSLGIRTSSSVEDISRIVSSGNNKLNSNKTPTATNGVQAYGTGYLACMYLGYLANGASDISERSITTGLNSVLKDMISGKSLDTVIREKSNGRYTGVSDFQNKFGDNYSSMFIKELTTRVGEGNGSLVAGDYSKSDILPDDAISISLFELNTENDTVYNIYPSDVNVFSGGGSTLNGNKPIEGYGEASDSPGAGNVDPPVVNPPIVDPPIQSGNKINLSNIESIDGIDYDRSSNTLTVTKNGDYTLSGVNSTGAKVVVKSGVQASITLDNAKINATSGEGIKLEENSNVTLKVTGDNTITSTETGKSAIYVSDNAVLNIEGDGKLTATGGDLAAAIDGGDSVSFENIKVTGGEITALGGRNASGIGCGMTIDGSSVVVKSIADDGVDSFEGDVAISNGIFSDGSNWTSHGEVIIKSTITVSGTFTSENGSTVTIAEGGKIGGTGSIKVKNGSTIKVENGGVIDAGSTIENNGDIFNRGKITTPCSPGIGNMIKNYINKVFNDLENQLNINIGQTLQEVLRTPTIEVLSNGERKQLTSSEVEIFDSNNRRVSNLSDVTVNNGDRFIYKVSFNLDKDSNEYFDEDGIVNSRLLEHNYNTVSQEHSYGRLVDSVISNGGKTITYTYALEAAASGSGSSGTGDTGKLNLQIGANSNQLLGINIDGMSASDLGLDAISVATAENASKAIDSCDEAIKKVSTTRSKLGAYQNRLEHTIANLDNSEENLQQSESRIRDLDIAKGMAEYSKYQILTQVDQAMLSQANQMANSVLNLLRA